MFTAVTALRTIIPTASPRAAGAWQIAPIVDAVALPPGTWLGNEALMIESQE